MNEVTRRQLMRKLDALPPERLYQVLDFIEFLESKYAPGRAVEPSGLQRFAEVFQDRLRARALTPSTISGAMQVLATADRVLSGMERAGKELLRELDTTTRAPDLESLRSTGVDTTLRPPELSGQSAPDTAAVWSPSEAKVLEEASPTPAPAANDSDPEER